MAKIIAISEHFQHFVEELQESFWGDLQARTRQAAQQFFDALSERQRDLYMVSRRYVRSTRASRLVRSGVRACGLWSACPRETCSGFVSVVGSPSPILTRGVSTSGRAFALVRSGYCVTRGTPLRPAC